MHVPSIVAMAPWIIIMTQIVKNHHAFSQTTSGEYDQKWYCLEDNVSLLYQDFYAHCIMVCKWGFIHYEKPFCSVYFIKTSMI